MISKLLLVAVLALMCGVAQSQELPPPVLKGEPVPSHGEKKGAADSQPEPSKQRDPSKLEAAIKGVEAAIRDRIPEEDKAERDRKESREISDLQAQKDMAIWAKSMFWATFVTMFLTAGGLALIWRTLHHTRRAADAAYNMITEAKQATVAAQDAVKVARDVGYVQTRPYVGIESIQSVYGTIQITIRNHGHAIAQHLTCHTLVFRKADDHFHDVLDASYSRERLPTWPPFSLFGNSTRIVTLERKNGFEMSTDSVFLAIKLVYTDDAGNAHRTREVFRAGGSGRFTTYGYVIAT